MENESCRITYAMYVIKYMYIQCLQNTLSKNYYTKHEQKNVWKWLSFMWKDDGGY